MKDSIPSPDINAIVSNRIERAKATLYEADFVFQNNMILLAISRLYYAAFYAASALLIKDGYTANSHNGVKQLLGLHYISTNILDRKHGIMYGRLFNARHSGDYDLFPVFSSEDVDKLFWGAKEFVRDVEMLLR